MISIQQLLGSAEQAAAEAGTAIMNIYRSGDLQVTAKPDASPVTRADKIADSIIRKHLSDTGLPVLSEETSAAGYAERRNWKYCWLVDPLDGTKEFIDRQQDFTVNIALVALGVPVAGVVLAPYTEVTWLGSEAMGVWQKSRSGVRELPALHVRPRIEELRARSGLKIVVSRSHLSDDTLTFIRQFENVQLLPMGSSLKFMSLVEGKADLYPRLGRTMEWDTAAAHAILHASNRGVYKTDLLTELSYNKPDLGNPFFVAF